MLQLLVKNPRYFLNFATIPFFRNVAILGSASAVSLISTTMLTMYVGRILGREEFGKFSTALAISYIVLSIVEFGFSVTLTREISVRPAKLEVHLSSVFLLRTAISGLTLIGISFLDYPSDIKAAIWGLSLYAIIFSLSNLFYSVFQAYEWFNWMSIIKIEGVIKLGLGILFLSFVKSILGVTIAWLGAALLTLVLCWGVYRWRIGPLRFHFEPMEVKYFFVESSYLAIAYIIWMAATRESTIILSLFRGIEEVALYEAANQWVGPISTTVYALFAAVMLPKIAKLNVTSKRQAQRLFGQTLALVIIGGIAVAIGVSLFSTQIILISVGPQFLDAVNVLKVLIWGMLCFNTIGLVGIALAATGHQRMSLVVVFVSFVINGIVGLVIIPPYGYIGAAIATTFSWMISAGLGLLILYTKVFDASVKVDA